MLQKPSDNLAVNQVQVSGPHKITNGAMKSYFESVVIVASFFVAAV